MARKVFWQTVYVDSRKVSKEKTLATINKNLGRYMRAVDAKPDKGVWIRGEGYMVPYRVKVKRTVGVL